MPKVNKLKTYVVVSRILVMIMVIAAIFILFTMRKTTCEPGELPEKYIHEPTVTRFDPGVFEQRRKDILASLDADIVILSAGARHDFRYLTGFPERRGIAVIIPGHEKEYLLFVTPREIYTVMWTGEVYGLEGAVEKYGAEAAHGMDDFNEMLPGLLKGKKNIYLHGDDNRITDAVENVLIETGQQAEIRELATVLHEHRVIKDDWEIAHLKDAAEVTVKAHQYVLQTVQPGLAEYEVQASIEYIFRRNGMAPGFSSIIGSGPNSCLLHHTSNDRILEDGDLLLMDVGAASRGGYTADVTRTIPVNGRFSPEQRKIYELVLKASDEALKKMKPGHQMLDCHHLATEILVEGLYDMGLVPDTSSWWQKRFYIQHRINHYIGLQVHDAGDYGFDTDNRNEHILTPAIRGREIKTGMVMTNEPGLYFMVGLLDGIHEMFGHLATEEELNAFVETVRPVYEKYEGIGVRIEDNILITEEGNMNLSRYAPRTVEEIEAAMR